MSLEKVVNTVEGQVTSKGKFVVPVGRQSLALHKSDLKQGDTVVVNRQPKSIKDIQPLLAELPFYRSASSIVYTGPSFTPLLQSVLEETFDYVETAQNMLGTLIGVTPSTVSKWYQGQTIAPQPSTRSELGKKLSNLAFLNSSDFDDAYSRVVAVHRVAGKMLQNDKEHQYREGVGGSPSFPGLAKHVRAVLHDGNVVAAAVNQGSSNEFGPSPALGTVTMQDVSDAYIATLSEVVGHLAEYARRNSALEQATFVTQDVYGVLPVQQTGEFLRARDFERMTATLEPSDKQMLQSRIREKRGRYTPAILDAITHNYVDRVFDFPEGTIAGLYDAVELFANVLPKGYHAAHIERMNTMYGNTRETRKQQSLQRLYGTEIRLYPLDITAVLQPERARDHADIPRSQQWQKDAEYWKDENVISWEDGKQALAQWDIQVGENGLERQTYKPPSQST